MKYKNIKLKENLLKAIEEVGYIEMTEIQEKAIPLALEGKSIIGQSQTGTGKTASFAIPIINNTESDLKYTQHIILTPTRELAEQVYKEFYKLTKGQGIKVVSIIGGVPYDKQERRVRDGAQIVVATPGRLFDFLSKGKIDGQKIKSFTLDEVDQLLAVGFQRDIIKINDLLAKKKQTFFYSATFSKKVEEISKKINPNDAIKIEISKGLSTVDSVKQEFIIVKKHNKFEMLKLWLKVHQPKGSIIFARTKGDVNRIVEQLKIEKFKVEGIQGDMVQKDRSRVMDMFRKGIYNVLVGTDVLARGIDISSLDYIYNYDLPEDIENYTHRIGRVGRNGKTGISLSFVLPSQIGYMRTIKKMTNSEVEEVHLPSQEVLDKVLVDRRYEFLNELLGRTNKHNLESFVSEAYSKEDISKMLSTVLRMNIKALKLDEVNKKDPNEGKRNNNRGGYNRNNNRGGYNRNSNSGGYNKNNGEKRKRKY
ncbi:MAG: DEAD/DEAH box helicase [Mollicutes bacterium PWAP]|nr:DEAD/DEAH box helicase [Mollicutes bacterium PWAP]